jgi:cell wall-associated NlpC family hydrolase
MATPFQQFKTKLGIGQPGLKGVGYDYTPTILQQGQSREQVGQGILDRISERKDFGQSLYDSSKQENTSRLATDLVDKSAGLKFDQFGKPEIKLGNFGDMGKDILSNIGQRGNLALQTEEAKAAFKNAVNMQNLGSYGLSGSFSVSGTGTDIPGASGNNTGAKIASMAMQIAANKAPYVWGGNSLTQGVDCSGLVQQLYAKMGIQVPRTTYEQAKRGKQVPVSSIRPGDLVFYRPGSRGPEHVGIYVGNGKIVHAANTRLGVITSNLNNSNGAPMLVLRPY